jgi:hypothetical protein
MAQHCLIDRNARKSAHQRQVGHGLSCLIALSVRAKTAGFGAPEDARRGVVRYASTKTAAGSEEPRRFENSVVHLRSVRRFLRHLPQERVVIDLQALRLIRPRRGDRRSGLHLTATMGHERAIEEHV